MTAPAPKSIADCPNPECRNPCKLAHTSGKHPWYFVRCALPETGKLHCCDYRGPQAMNKEEAIRLHNLVCTHPHGPGLCVDCDDSGPQQSAEPVAMRVTKDSIDEVHLLPFKGPHATDERMRETGWTLTPLFTASPGPSELVEEMEAEIARWKRDAGEGTSDDDVALRYCAARVRALITRHRGKS